MLWSAKCLYPKASNLDNMSGRFIKTLLAESNNFMSVRNSVQCCHVLDQMDHFSGFLKSTWCLFAKDEVSSAIPGQFPTYLFAY